MSVDELEGGDNQVESSEEVFASGENTLVCILSGKPMKATPKEKTLQMVARSLSGEYGFRVEDMERDFKVAYSDPNTGKTRRMTLSLVVFGGEFRTCARKHHPDRHDPSGQNQSH